MPEDREHADECRLRHPPRTAVTKVESAVNRKRADIVRQVHSKGVFAPNWTVHGYEERRGQARLLVPAGVNSVRVIVRR